MADELRVAHGRVVEVDTAQLWAAAAAMAHQGRRVRDVVAEVEAVRHALWQLHGGVGWDVHEAARRAAEHAERTASGLGWLGERLARTAEEYEHTELAARWALARLQGDVHSRALLEQRATALGVDVATLDDGPDLGARARAWWEFASQYALALMSSPLGPVGAGASGAALFALLTFIDTLDRGTVWRGGALQGPAKHVSVQQLVVQEGAVRAPPLPPLAAPSVAAPSAAASPAAASTTAASPATHPTPRLTPRPTPHPAAHPTADPTPHPSPRPAGAAAGSRARPGGSAVYERTVAPPESLAALARRIPGGAAQVSIERFAMPDGRTEWGVYIAGTRSAAMGGSEPWDMRSNTELYFGERSASSDAVLEAMRIAGVHPRDPVHLVGHSQGGMIAAGVAVSGAFEVGSLTTFGSPVDAQLPESVLSVRVRHDDDPVAALAGAGSIAGTGSPDSVVVSRTGDARPGIHDLTLPMHALDAYVHTAEQYQGSGDVRVRSVERLLDRLGEAERVTRTEYRAVRPD